MSCMRLFSPKLHIAICFSFLIILLLDGCGVAKVNYMSPKGSVVHITDFGAKGDGITNCTTAFQSASAWLQQKGGKLIIDKGTYVVGRQKLSGAYGAAASYISEPILFFRNTKHPIEIIGENAILKAAPGLKYGSFNPVTGKNDSLRTTGNFSDYYAAGVIFISSYGAVSMKIRGLELDGNSQSLDIGPAFGPEGIQLPAIGITLFNSQYAEVSDCNIHHCGLDAIIIAWTGLKDADPTFPHIIRNVKATYNGRQGLSWVGGNHLTVTDCEFSSTGKAINNRKAVVSKPSAGIDIEIEQSIIKNGLFENCIIYDNAGPGLSTIGHDTYDINFRKCTFIGTTNSAAYPKSQNLSFDSCTFVGRVERIFGSKDKQKAISFKDCLFTLEQSMSPGGKVFGDTWEFYEGQNVVFDRCTFNAAGNYLPACNQKEIVFKDCDFYQNSDKDFWASAIFRGTTRFIMKGKGNIDERDAKFEGPVFINGKRIN